MIKIAIAEDHPKMRSFLVSMIELEGDMTVIFKAETGKKLLHWLQQTDTLPDICVSDINMPVMNGYQTIEAILSQWPDMKILVMSTDNHTDRIEKALRLGARGFITKDIPPQQIRDAIRHIYNTGYSVESAQDQV